MKQHLAILLWAAAIDRPPLVAAPFVHAAAAAALDCEVEIHFSGPAVRLLVDGVAAALRPWPDEAMTIYSMMRQAANLNVRLLACGMAMQKYVAAGETLIPEYGGTAAAGAFVQRALDPDWATLVY